LIKILYFFLYENSIEIHNTIKELTK